MSDSGSRDVCQHAGDPRRHGGRPATIGPRGSPSAGAGRGVISLRLLIDDVLIFAGVGTPLFWPRTESATRSRVSVTRSNRKDLRGSCRALRRMVVICARGGRVAIAFTRINSSSISPLVSHTAMSLGLSSSAAQVMGCGASRRYRDRRWPGACAAVRAARPRWCLPKRRLLPLASAHSRHEVRTGHLRIRVWRALSDAAPGRRSQWGRTTPDRCRGARRDHASPGFRSGLGVEAGRPAYQSLRSPRARARPWRIIAGCVVMGISHHPGSCLACVHTCATGALSRP